MSERQFEDLFTQFLNGYWGAFHELLEAQSIRPDRLAESLFQDVIDQHSVFAAARPEEAAPATDALGRLWREVIDRRRSVPDAPLTADQVRQALEEFTAIYEVLLAVGHRYPLARANALKRALHATPKAPLRADAAH